MRIEIGDLGYSNPGTPRRSRAGCKFTLGHPKPGRYSVQFTSKAGFVRGKQEIIELKDGERRTGVLLSQ